MQDHELYQRIAESIVPWTIGDFHVETTGQRIDVLVECLDTVPKQCPHCDCMLLVCDYGEEQTWRQPDAGAWQILLRGRLPVIECPEHGLVRVSPPWADWYVRGLDKAMVGPWSLQQLKMLLDAGRISPSTLLKRSTAEKWVIAGTVGALFVRQDETVEPPLSVDELAAVDWAIAQEPIVFESIEPDVGDDVVSDHLISDHPFSDRLIVDDGATDDIAPQDFATQSFGRTDIERRDSGLEDSGPNSHVPQGDTSGSNTTEDNPPGGDTARGNVPRRRAADGGLLRHLLGYRGSHNHKWPRFDRSASEPDVAGVAPANIDAAPGLPDDGRELRLLEDAGKERASETEPRQPTAPREREQRPAPREKPRPSSRPKKPLEPSPSEWGMAIEQAVEMELTANVIRQKPEDNAAAEPVKASSRREALVRRRGFLQGYQLLLVAYLVNACVVCCLVPAVCMIFFARLLLLSTSVFAPFEGGNDLQEGQLVECGLAALSLLVLVAFPIWQLKANDGPLLHYIPSALIGMAVGFGLPPGYLDEVCSALQWCEVIFGMTTVGLLVYTLSVVPARTRMSLPMIGAGVLTGLSVLALFFVRSGSMLSVQTDTIPPQLRGATPDAPLYVLGLYGTLIFIPGAMLFELYRHTDYDTRQLIVRTGVIGSVYLVAGFATLDALVHGARSGFFDVPLALLPLGCINALAAAVPAVLFLANPQYSLTED